MSTVTRYRHTFLSAAKTALQIKIAHPTPLSFASFGTSGLNYFCIFCIFCIALRRSRYDPIFRDIFLLFLSLWHRARVGRGPKKFCFRVASTPFDSCILVNSLSLSSLSPRQIRARFVGLIKSSKHTFFLVFLEKSPILKGIHLC